MLMCKHLSVGKSGGLQGVGVSMKVPDWGPMPGALYTSMSEQVHAKSVVSLLSCLFALAPGQSTKKESPHCLPLSVSGDLKRGQESQSSSVFKLSNTK